MGKAGEKKKRAERKINNSLDSIERRTIFILLIIPASTFVLLHIEVGIEWLQDELSRTSIGAPAGLAQWHTSPELSTSCPTGSPFTLVPWTNLRVPVFKRINWSE